MMLGTRWIPSPPGDGLRPSGRGRPRPCGFGCGAWAVSQRPSNDGRGSGVGAAEFMQRRGGLPDRCHTRPRRSAKEEKIATRSNPIDRALKTHKSRSRMVSAAILAVGVLVVLAVLLSPGRRRERAAGELAFGEDSTTVLERMGDSPRRCPTGTLEHVYDAFEGAIPRQTREAVLERMRRETATRWIYPGRNGCTPRRGDVEIGFDRDGRVLWIVPSTRRVPLQY